MGSSRYDVIVVGAGGGGAILGLALAQRGVSVCIIERQRTRSTLPRAETIQPNGQEILHRLGLLEALNNEAVQSVQRFHFFRIGGSRLCSVDYGMLPAPWNRALVAQSNKVHELLLDRLTALPAAELQTGVEFQSLIQRNGFVTGVMVRYPDSQHPVGLEAPLVVGADGAESLVRQTLGLPSKFHRYRHGYLTVLLPRPSEMDGEGRYYMGRGELLGMFPAPEDRVVALYMVEAAGVNDFRARGLDRFKQRLAAIDPSLRGSLESLTTWAQVGFLPCARVLAERWVADGAVLLGDAAHAMNPHASQGRMQAMTDAMTLADVIMECRERGDWSAKALSQYERVRRPQVTMLQGLADEQTMFWNASDPVRCYLRDRVLRGMDQNPRLRYQALTATAGLRMSPPMTWIDKLMAVGLLPDAHANEIPQS